MRPIYADDKRLSGDTRLIERLYETEPSENRSEKFIFALQYLWFHEGKWLELARIDNYWHQKDRLGVHIHRFGNRFVEFKEMSFDDAQQIIRGIAGKIKQRILLGDLRGKN